MYNLLLSSDSFKCIYYKNEYSCKLQPLFKNLNVLPPICYVAVGNIGIMYLIMIKAGFLSILL